MTDVRPLVPAIHELSEADSRGEIAAVVCRHARRLLRAEGVCFVVRDGSRCRYIDESSVAPLWKGSRFPLDECVSGWCMRHRAAVVVADVAADPRTPARYYRDTFVTSLAMVPICQSTPVGAVGVYWSARHEASAAQMEVLQALADAASVAWARVMAGSRRHAVESPMASSEERCRNLYVFIRLCLGHGVSDREIARRWGMNWRSYLNLKGGSRRVPRLEELEGLAAVLSVDPALVILVARGEPAETVHRWLLGGPASVRTALLARLDPAETRAGEPGPAARDRLPGGSFTMDLRGRLRDLDERLRALSAAAAAIAPGDRASDLLAPDSIPLLLKLETQALEHGESGPELVLLADRVPVDAVLVRLDDRDGRPVGFHVVLRTFSERVRSLLDPNR